MDYYRNTVRLVYVSFDNVENGLICRGKQPLKGFVIAGEDRKFVPADAVIDGETIVVSAEGVVNPKAVRYAWCKSPEVNLFDRNGLPIAPFRSDDWPCITFDIKTIK